MHFGFLRPIFWLFACLPACLPSINTNTLDYYSDTPARLMFVCYVCALALIGLNLLNLF
jgi:hypothetical protein